MVEFKQYIEGWWTVLYFEQVYVFGNRTDQRISCDGSGSIIHLGIWLKFIFKSKLPKTVIPPPPAPRLPSFICFCSVDKLCPTLCNLMDCSPPGFLCPWDFPGRILEWVAISSSRGSSQPRGRTQESFISCIDSRILLPLSHVGNLIRVYWTKLNPGKLVLPLCTLAPSLGTYLLFKKFPNFIMHSNLRSLSEYGFWFIRSGVAQTFAFLASSGTCQCCLFEDHIY